MQMDREWWMLRGGQGFVEETLGNGGDSMGMGNGGLGNTVDYWAGVDMH